MRRLIAFFSGLVFGLGLLLGGMANPQKVKAFLDIAGAWDPSLALVMGGAIAVAVFAFARARRRPRAWSGNPIELPKSQGVDMRLVVGGVLFGIGWGIAGYCPGPALVALGSGSVPAAIFVAAMLVGMTVYDAIVARRSPSTTSLESASPAPMPGVRDTEPERH
jgi:uncharacterized membrane protein YedE/YeeE